MDKTTKTLKRLCKVVDILKGQSKKLLEIQEQTYSTDIEYVNAQEGIKGVAESILKIMEKILEKSEKND